MKYAWVENNKIRDVSNGIPSDLYHPDVAIHYNTEVPDEAENGDSWVDGVLIKPESPPVISAPSAIVYKKISPVEFKLLFTSAERIAIKTSADPVVQDFFEIVNDPRLTYVDLGLQSTQDALSYLVLISVITQERKDEILLGDIV